MISPRRYVKTLYATQEVSFVEQIKKTIKRKKKTVKKRMSEIVALAHFEFK